MTNDELKKKIVEILFPVLKGSRISCNEENACKQCWFPCEVDRLADSLADALIATGLTFDKTTAILAERTNGKTLIHKAQYYDEIKHRAEVAERALQIADELGELCGRKEDYVQQAEKELAEGAK